MEELFPDNVQVYSIGQTVQGREQYVVKLSSNVTEERGLLVTPIKLVANMHGDETLGRVSLYFNFYINNISLFFTILRLCY
jgi:hypothetical protein